jgi:hypothetical protein
MACLLASACYTFVPTVTPPPAGPGTVVRVALTLDGTLAVQGRLGPNVGAITGPLVRATTDSLTVTLQEARLMNGQVLSVRGADVAVARTHVASLATRSHAKGRTALLVLAGLAAAVGVAVAVGSAAGGSGEPGVGQPPQP